MSEPETVREAWNMACPNCRSDESIQITAQVWVDLHPDGTEEDDFMNGGHEWDNNSACHCYNCGFSGTVGDFDEDSFNAVKQSMIAQLVEENLR